MKPQPHVIQFVDEYLAEGMDDPRDLGIVIAQALLQADSPDYIALRGALVRIRMGAEESNFSKELLAVLDGIDDTLMDWGIE